MRTNACAPGMDVLKVGSPAEKNTKMVTTLATLKEEGRTSEVGEW